MKVKIKRFDTSLPLPQYETEGAAAFDLYSRVDITIPPFTVTLIPLNVAIKIEPGHVLFLAARSSLPIKKGLMMPNGIGIVDEDYCGDEDEIKLEALNFTRKDVHIKKGEKIAQALLVKIDRVKEIEEVTTMTDKSRGGFGTTTKK